MCDVNRAQNVLFRTLIRNDEGDASNERIIRPSSEIGAEPLFVAWLLAIINSGWRAGGREQTNTLTALGNELKKFTIVKTRTIASVVLLSAVVVHRFGPSLVRIGGPLAACSRPGEAARASDDLVPEFDICGRASITIHLYLSCHVSTI